MHLLVLPSFLPPYGGQFALDQAQALSDYGHRVAVVHCQQLGLTVFPRHFVTPPAAPEGVTLYDTFPGLPLLTRLNQRRYVSRVLTLYERYAATHGHPDLIHAHSLQWAGTAARAIQRRYGTPYVVTEHLAADMLRAVISRHPWAARTLGDALLSAAALVTVSRRHADELATLLPRHPHTVTISNVTGSVVTGGVGIPAYDVTGGVGIPAYDKTRRQECLRPQSPRRFCCLAIANGFFFRLKGYDTLLAAWHIYGNTADTLHIAGRATRSRRFRRAITDTVTLHGDLTHPEAMRLLESCDALVLASRAEVQPLAVLEALTRGIPVIATSAAVPDELRGPGVVIADTPEALAAAFAAPLPHPDARRYREMTAPATVAKALTTLYTTIKGAAPR